MVTTLWANILAENRPTCWYGLQYHHNIWDVLGCWRHLQMICLLIARSFGSWRKRKKLLVRLKPPAKTYFPFHVTEIRIEIENVVPTCRWDIANCTNISIFLNSMKMLAIIFSSTTCCLLGLNLKPTVPTCWPTIVVVEQLLAAMLANMLARFAPGFGQCILIIKQQIKSL